MPSYDIVIPNLASRAYETIEIYVGSLSALAEACFRLVFPGDQAPRRSFGAPQDYSYHFFRSILSAVSPVSSCLNRDSTLGKPAERA